MKTDPRWCKHDKCNNEGSFSSTIRTEEVIAPLKSSQSLNVNMKSLIGVAPNRTPACDDSTHQQCSSMGSLSPILAAWLLGAPATVCVSAVAGGRIEGSDKQAQSRVLRKQTDPARGGGGQWRKDRPAGSRRDKESQRMFLYPKGHRVDARWRSQPLNHHVFYGRATNLSTWGGGQRSIARTKCWMLPLYGLWYIILSYPVLSYLTP